jgi:hypothetical protein
MAYNSYSQIGGYTPGSVDTVPKVAAGTITYGDDPSYGQGSFVYMPGVASTVAGSVVGYSLYGTTTVSGVVYDGATTLAVAATRGPVAVATAATVAGTWGWYQITGTASVSSASVTAGNTVALTSTAGQVTNSTTSGQKIDGMYALTATTNGQSVCILSNPFANGNT